jgi:hypothetical protein
MRRLPSRRAFLRTTAGLFVAGGATGLYAWQVEPTWLSIEKLELPIANLPSAFDGFTVAQISDLHASDIVPVEWLRECAAATNALKPDLIAVTGDFVTAGHEFVETAAEICAALRAPAGVLGVLGNHDYYGAQRTRKRQDHPVAENLGGALSRAGVTVLRNTATEVRRAGAALQFVGFEDLLVKQFRAEAGLGAVNAERPVIALSHNPDTIESLAPAGVDIVLSGHTHGGQVSLPFYGPPFLPMKNKNLVSGLYEFGRTRLYVNPGLGWLRWRLRLLARPEITLITLRAA